jgi:hypothetical protein
MLEPEEQTESIGIAENGLLKVKALLFHYERIDNNFKDLKSRLSLILKDSEQFGENNRDRLLQQVMA